MLEYLYNEDQNFLHVKPKPAVLIEDILEHTGIFWRITRTPEK